MNGISNMKKNLLILGIGCLIVTVAYAASTKIKNTAAGYQIGTEAEQKIGFWGIVPTTQQVVTVSTDSTTITNILAALRVAGIIRTN